MDEEVYIVDQLEHGNGGVFDYKLLDILPLEKALLKRPGNYGVFRKEWGFWPIITTDKEYKNKIYYWEEDTETWEKFNG